MQDLAVQTSTYGKVIPTVYGTVRIAGNVIWSRPIKETAVTTTQSGGGKGGGGKVQQSSTEYSYSVSLAIAICAGEISEIQRVWADARLLNLDIGTYRLYKGSETQTPDSFIESFEGVGNTPAYRGISYVVIEDFPLADYGNRIPNFTFEVKRKLKNPDWLGESTEDMIKSVIMIPGSGEFVYDTQVDYKVFGEQVGANWVQAGAKIPVNMHNHRGRANALEALDQMKETLPNLEWVGVVVNWFATSLDPATCVILPGVEYQANATTEPEVWTSAGFSRATAHPITIIGDTPRYGGTPDDQSLIRFLDEIKARGYSIMFYPMPLVDTDGKPWRGQITGTASATNTFFTKTNGYNAFINHYATLVAGKVDAFVIGSELIGLTKVTDTPGNYPAVNQLVSLAATVKSTLGAGVKVTYAADWSEYHHTDGGWYNLDPLWASPNIDVVGIDAYFPLADEPQDNDYPVQQVIDGWTEGEGYDWYYTDVARTTQATLAPAYAWKNIDWWWKNQHYNPSSGTPTAWVPESKPIWFTEYGFPSVDGSINQPNVFYDPESVVGNLPRFSRGRIDNLAQRQGITGTEAKWKTSTMIERRFLWTWDARPYPFWPDRQDIWADGDLYKYGHWVQGKLGLSSLAAIVRDICLKVGLTDSDIDVTRLRDQVEGYVLNFRVTARDAIETLMAGYFFDAVESDNILKFVPRGGDSALTINSSDLVFGDGGGSETGDGVLITRQQEVELPAQVDVTFYNIFQNHQVGNQASQRQTTESQEIVTLSLPIVMGELKAKNIAEKAMYSRWTGRTSYSFSVPVEYAKLEPTDVITLQDGAASYMLRLVDTTLISPGVLECLGVAEDAAAYDFYLQPGEQTPQVGASEVAVPTTLKILDLPCFPADDSTSGVLRFAGRGLEGGWRGSVIYRSTDAGANYAAYLNINNAAIMGGAVNALGNFTGNFYDLTNKLTVLLVGGELESVSELALLNGANTCVVGSEVLQFKTATLIAPDKYELSHLLRGRLGTEWAASIHSAGEEFVLINGAVIPEAIAVGNIGLARMYKPVSIGSTLGATTAITSTYSGRALRPYAPVHINGSRDGAGNLTIGWVRRTRSGGELRDYVDAPLSESFERYEVEVINGVDVVRTISGLSSPTASYSSAEQIADFGSIQSSVSLRVYQISEAIGRGYACVGNA